MTTTVASKPRSGGRVLAVLGAVVVASLIIGWAVSESRSSRSYEPGTPEAVVQEYVGHVLAGRMSEALLLLKNPGLCQWSFAGVHVPDGLRADLISSTVSESGDFAYVGLRFEQDNDGLLDPGDNSWQVTFALERTEVGWRLISPTWPAPICGMPG